MDGKVDASSARKKILEKYASESMEQAYSVINKAIEEGNDYCGIRFPSVVVKNYVIGELEKGGYRVITYAGSTLECRIAWSEE